MRPWLAALSLVLSRMTGGEPGEYLCVRIARRWGSYCLFCRMIGRITEDGHCRRLLFDWNYRK